MRFQRSQGISLSPKGAGPTTAEILAANFSAITDFSKATYPTSPASALQEMMAAQERAAAAESGNTSSKGASSPNQTAAKAALNSTPFPSDAIFRKIQNIIDTDNAKYVFTPLLTCFIFCTIYLICNYFFPNLELLVWLRR